MTTAEPITVPQPGEKVLFITGRLAAEVVKCVVADVSQEMKFSADICVVGISVAALMHVDWLKRKLTKEPFGFDKVYLPGWCQGDITVLSELFDVPFHRGPKDILDLSTHFGRGAKEKPALETYNIDIIAEINHAPRLTEKQIVTMAQRYRAHGADVIDIGCVPGETWAEVGNVIQLLKSEGFRLSIDSFDRFEVETAVANGAELVLSCNRSNVDWLGDLGTEVVVIPDDPANLQTMWQTVDCLVEKGCDFRIDPILEPIGFGFAASLARYYEARRIAPTVPMMMGIGNLTEMTEVDSAGINVLLSAICEELKIHSVLTTEVIPWCQSAVQEFDIARRLMKHAVENQTLPKHVSSELVLLRDSNQSALGEEALQSIANDIKDANFRLFVERDEIHIMNREGYWRGTDAFELFDQFSTAQELDASHAFYLGYELCKAVTALTLGKQYRQDQSLQWGFLTVPEVSVHVRRKDLKRKKEARGDE